MRILLTGAAGFVGAAVTRQALANGDTVGALLSPSNPAARLSDVSEQVSVFRGRLEDTNAVRAALQAFQPEACIHLAWYAEPGKYLTSPENLNSLTASIGLLQQLAETGCAHVVMAGTCAEYDTNAGYLSETSPTKPETIYAATKLAMQVVGAQFPAEIGFTWARLFYIYGPDEDERRLTPALINTLLDGKPFAATPGEQIRDYLHVTDVASALLRLAHQHSRGTYNIASGCPISIRVFMETVAALAGRSGAVQFGALPYRAWEPMFICGNNQKLKDAGWSPRYSLRDGLEQTVNWWKQKRSR